jgi:hypothetical protein
VRVVNGRVIDRAAFPKGLTIVSNLPMFALGDINSTSVPASKPSAAKSMNEAGANWRPLLLGADIVTLQSTSWEDWRSNWNAPVSDAGTRVAGATTYHFEVLTGWLESAAGSRDETFYVTRPVENWEPVARTLRGSIVIGFGSVFAQRFDWNWRSNNDGSSSNAPKLHAYDYMLDILDNQPPGSPRFQVTATETFKRN